MGARGVVGDKWSQKILWLCAIGSAISLYFVAVERQAQNRARQMAEGLKGFDGAAAGSSEGFANHGFCEEALQLFPEMLEGGVVPDAVTFLGILTACSRAGLLDAGCQYFDYITKNYAVEPSVDHYACMVDLVGRAGLVEEAYDLVRTMPVEPHAGVWGALLNACRTYCNMEVAKIAAQELFKIEPENSGNYVLLSNIYAGGHFWQGVSDVRCLMRGRRVTKTAGCSWIDVNTEKEEFLMGDITHPLNEEISAVLRHLSLQTV